MFRPLHIVCRYRYAEPQGTAGPYWECLGASPEETSVADALANGTKVELTIALVYFVWSLELGIVHRKDYTVDPKCYHITTQGKRPQSDKLKGLVLSYIQDHVFGCCAESLLSKLPATIKEFPCPKTTKT